MNTSFQMEPTKILRSFESASLVDSLGRLIFVHAYNQEQNTAAVATVDLLKLLLKVHYSRRLQKQINFRKKVVN